MAGTANEAPESRGGSRHTLAWQAGAVLGLGLFLTLLAWVLSSQQVDRLAEQRFRARAEELAGSVVARLENYEQILRGGVAFIEATGGADRTAWRTYVAGLRVEERYPGIQGIGFAPRVMPGELAAHEAAVRAEGFPTYSVKPPMESGERGMLFPILFLEPFAGRNLRAFGFDMFADPVRRAAMRRAMETGASSASGKVTLVQETAADVQPGFLIYLPVYDPASPVSTAQERRAAIRGFVFSPFRMNDLMDTLVAGPFRRDLDVRILDGTGGAESALLYDSPGEAGTGHRLTAAVAVFGRSWTLDIHSTPAFEQSVDRRAPTIVLVAGTIIGVLLMAVARSLLLEQERTAALRRSYGEVTLARSEAEHANAAKTRFLAAASHDLRQPLQTLGIYLHLIGEHPAAEPMRRLVNGARDGFEAAQRMLNSLMDIASLEAGAAQPKPRPVDLCDFVERVGGELRVEAEAKGLSLRIKLTPLWVDTDPHMLERILRNLLHNALKYTGRGTILLAVRQARDGSAVIKVQDTGPGIPADRLHLIFEDFYQVGNPERDRSKGLGLGLATVSRLARLLGCRVGVRSRPGRGAVFTVALPNGRTKKPEPERAVA